MPPSPSGPEPLDNFTDTPQLNLERYPDSAGATYLASL